MEPLHRNLRIWWWAFLNWRPTPKWKVYDDRVEELKRTERLELYIMKASNLLKTKLVSLEGFNQWVCVSQWWRPIPGKSLLISNEERKKKMKRWSSIISGFIQQFGRVLSCHVKLYHPSCAQVKWMADAWSMCPADAPVLWLDLNGCYRRLLFSKEWLMIELVVLCSTSCLLFRFHHFYHCASGASFS